MKSAILRAFEQGTYCDIGVSVWVSACGATDSRSEFDNGPSEPQPAQQLAKAGFRFLRILDAQLQPDRVDLTRKLRKFKKMKHSCFPLKWFHFFWPYKIVFQRTIGPNNKAFNNQRSLNLFTKHLNCTNLAMSIFYFHDSMNVLSLILTNKEKRNHKYFYKNLKRIFFIFLQYQKSMAERNHFFIFLYTKNRCSRKNHFFIFLPILKINGREKSFFHIFTILKINGREKSFFHIFIYQKSMAERNHFFIFLQYRKSMVERNHFFIFLQY